MTFSEGDTKRDVVSGIHRDVLKSKTLLRNNLCPPRFQWLWWLKGRLWWGGRAYPVEAAKPQIEKERSWAKPTQLPAGPRKKRPLGRLFSSLYIFFHFPGVQNLRADLKSVIWPRFTGAGGDKRRDHATGDHRSSRMWSSAASGGKYGHI